MDKETVEMIRRAEASLDYRKLDWLEEAAEEEAMTGYKFDLNVMWEIWERHPELMPSDVKQFLLTNEWPGRLMQARKPRLPPSRGVLVILPLALIEQLDHAADVLNMNRSDIIRRSLVRDASGALREDVSRQQGRQVARTWAHWRD